MRTFEDTQRRSWTIDIHVASLKRIRDLTSVDLLELVEGQYTERLLRDPVLLCDVVYAAIKPELDEHNLTDEQFGCAMSGDALEAATEALLEELVAFCPSPRDRAALGRVLTATREVREHARDLVEARLDEMTDPDRLSDLATGAVCGERSTSAPASSASTPPP